MDIDKIKTNEEFIKFLETLINKRPFEKRDFYLLIEVLIESAESGFDSIICEYFKRNLQNKGKYLDGIKMNFQQIAERVIDMTSKPILPMCASAEYRSKNLAESLIEEGQQLAEFRNRNYVKADETNSILMELDPSKETTICLFYDRQIKEPLIFLHSISRYLQRMDDPSLFEILPNAVLGNFDTVGIDLILIEKNT
ncbi:MAG: hypothetical protein ABIM99_01970 [Candidatus Dojkabacteria bacterium]